MAGEKPSRLVTWEARDGPRECTIVVVGAKLTGSLESIGGIEEVAQYIIKPDDPRTDFCKLSCDHHRYTMAHEGPTPKRVPLK